MINEIKAKEGYVFATPDKSEVYGSIIVLGIYDSADNYIQIPIEEATLLEKEKEEKRKAELEALKAKEEMKKTKPQSMLRQINGGKKSW